MRWTIGDLSLDSDAYELLRGGDRVAVEPRVLDLLVFLIQHRERVVSKDELLSQVWHGQHVGESALTRCVYEARRALDDDAERQDLVKTVYGRGYQFVGPVEECEAATPARASRLRPSRWWLLAGSVALLTGLGVVALDRPGSEVIQEVRAEPDLEARGASTDGTVGRLALVPFHAIEGLAESELTALSLSDQLWYWLGSQPGLVVRSLEFGAALEAADLDPAAIAETAQVDAVLTGQLERTTLADRYQLSVSLHEVDSDGRLHTTPVGTYEIPPLDSRSGLEHFVSVREAIAADVIEHLQPTLVLRTAEGISPRDPEALRLYLQARARFATISCGDSEMLLDLLDRSLQRDPEFAVAWVAKGFALYSQSWSCGRESAFTDKALEAARRGRELAPGLPGAVLLETLLLVERGSAEEAYASLLEVWDGVGTSPLASFARAYALRYAGFLELSSDSLDHTLELDPLFLREFGYAPTSYLYSGDVDRFLELLPAADTAHDRYYRGVGLFRSGRLDEARQVVEPAFRLNPADLFGRFSSALTAIVDEDDATALEIVRGIVRQREGLGTPDGEMTFKEAQLLAWAGSGEEALDRLEAAVAGGFFCPACLLEEPGFAPWRATPRFQAVVEQARTRHRAFGARFDLPLDG